MKKSLVIAILVISLSCFISANADAMNISSLEKRDTFFYDDETYTSWTYYQYVDKSLLDGTYIELFFVEWGNDSEITDYPEFRIFSSSVDAVDIIVQSATIMIDGNMYELSFEEVDLDGSHGSSFYLTSKAIPFMKSLATASNFSAVFRYDGGNITISLDENQVVLISQYMYDLLNIDYLHLISNSETANESWYQEKTPIESYIFNEVVLDVQSEEQNSVEQNNEDEWKEYNLNDIGIKVYLPSNFIVFTRGMKKNDPTAVAVGMTPNEIDQALINSNLYLEATQDDFDSEIMVTMVGNLVSDFSSMSDGGLLMMSNMLDSNFESIGAVILDRDVFSVNGVKYIRMHQRQMLDDGNIIYRIQYYTTVDNQAVNFVFVSSGDDVTEKEKEFMQSIVERVSFGNEIVVSIPETFVQDPSNFTYVVQEDGTACITEYNGYMGVLSIPESIDGYKVSTIDIEKIGSIVTNVFIPDSVTSIISNPFGKWYSLKTVTVSESHPSLATVDGILYSRDMQKLICYPCMYPVEEFTVPSNVKTIAADAFHGVSLLSKLVLPEGLIEIGEEAFFDLNKITSITIPASVKIINGNPFYAMNGLEEIRVADGNDIFVVHDNALYNRETNYLISLPRKCIVSSFSFPEGIIGIADNAFEHNKSEIYIQFPDSLETIGEWAFSHCNYMIFSDLPANLKSIGSGAFMESSIKEIRIPASVEYMGNACFAYCSDAKIYVIEGSYAESRCKENETPYQYYESDSILVNSIREYNLQAGPFTVKLDESKYNILTPDMSADDPALIRSGFDSATLKAYMAVTEKALWMFDISEQVPPEFDITIKIKEKYKGLDVRDYSSSGVEYVLNTLYSGFEDTASNKEIVVINNIPYLKFNWMYGSELRYATIINGDMIYIFAERNTGTITDEDAILLLSVVESIQYP